MWRLPFGICERDPGRHFLAQTSGRGPEFTASSLRFRSVDPFEVLVDDYPIYLKCGLATDIPLQYIHEHADWVPNQRVSEAPTAGRLMSEEVTPSDRTAELRRQLFDRVLAEEGVSRRFTGLPAAETVRENLPPVGSDLKRGFRSEQSVVPDEPDATAEAPRTTRVRHKLVPLDPHRIESLNRLD
jgi:hypothetical protein